MEVDKALDNLRRRFSGDPPPTPTDASRQPAHPTRPATRASNIPPPPSRGNEIQMSSNIEFAKTLDNCFEQVEMDKGARDAIKKSILLNFEQHTATTKLKERLAILFEYEKSYLGLVKEYKDEIKFIGALQEDLRKERAKFFSDTLKEVSESLRDTQVSSEVASQWIKELVDSYTRSLDLSSGLIEEQTVDTMGQIRKQAKEAVQAATRKDDDSA